jgi:glutamate-1-semialdehyde 2,1-aminomutase
LFRDTESYSQWELKTLFLQEVFARGILVHGPHNMSYAHSDADIARLLEVYNEVFGIIGEVLEKRNLDDWLGAEALVPLFKIR